LSRVPPTPLGVGPALSSLAREGDERGRLERDTHCGEWSPLVPSRGCSPGMQPIGHNVRSDILRPSSLAVARAAFLHGDFDACFRALDEATLSNPAERREATLFRARALIRTQRFAEVVTLLGPVLSSFVTVDEACTARMLHGAAVSRTADGLDRGLELLAEVANAAAALHAHRAIRAEIAYMIAFVHWMKRDYPTTLHYAILAEREGADIISVRAASLRGYVAIAKERYPEALGLFRFALHGYRSCQETDADLVERIVVQVASLEVTLRSAKVLGTHTLPPELARVGNSGRARASVFRMEIAALDAWLYAFDDDRRNAYYKVRLAEDLAPNPAWRVFALANRAKIAAAFDDVDIAREFATQALELVEAVDWNATSDDERFGLLHLAEILARTEPLSAVEVLRRYDALTTNIDRSLLFTNDIRLWILETFVRGLVHRIRGEMHEAWDSFKAVNAAGTRVGVLWRATQALIELDATPIASGLRGDQYLQAAALLVRKHFPRSFLARRLGPWMEAHRDPIAARLRPQPREVMRHLLAGKNPKEISSIMALSEDTVKGYIKMIFRAFAVNSTPQLLVACYERGIGSPTWWNVLNESNPPSIVGERIRPANDGRTR
jgi:DNA-binding CsgD family transcriptional regulator